MGNSLVLGKVTSNLKFNLQLYFYDDIDTFCIEMYEYALLTT